MLTRAVSIAVVLVGLLVAPSLPQTFELPADFPNRDAVRVAFDDYGVPTIVTADLRTRYFAFGYLCARDRFFEMDVMRRKAKGELSALVGDSFLQDDVWMRTLDLKGAAVRTDVSLRGGARAAIDAYSDGVNFYLSKSDTLPAEYSMLGKPERWSPSDSLAIGKLISWTVSDDFDTEMDYESLVAQYGEDKAKDLVGDLRHSITSIIKADDMPPNASTSDAASKAAGVLASLSENLRYVGSNSFVVAGSRTSTGFPILACDPHLEITFPSIWWEVRLSDGKDVDVRGASIPGVAAILVGATKNFAWGITMVGADTEDVYRFAVNPDNHAEYKTTSGWREFEKRREKIIMRTQEGKTDEQEITLNSTMVGPVVKYEKGSVLALRWTGLDGDDEPTAFFDLDRATDLASFRDAISKMSTVQNFIYAGVDGTIGCFVAGRVPVRAFDGGRFAKGDDPHYAWSGVYPASELPSVLNPEVGYVVCANDRVGPEGVPGPDDFLQGTRDAGNRAKRMEDMIAAAPKLRPEDAMAIQTDTYSLQAEKIVPVLLRVLKSTDFASHLTQVESAALSALSDWNLRDDIGSTGATVYHVTMQFIYQRVSGSPDFTGYERRAVDRLLLGGLKFDWLPKTGDSAAQPLGAIIKDSFIAAAAFLKDNYGRDAAKWTWGGIHKMALVHPNPLAALVSPGSVTSPGSFDTVAVGPYRMVGIQFAQSFGPSFRMVVDLSHPLARYYSVLPGGESGDPRSSHFKDQVALYLEGGYKYFAKPAGSQGR